MSEKTSRIKNIWVLSGLLIGISIVFGYLGKLISFPTASGILSAIIVGHLYASKLEEIIPTNTAIKIISIYALFHIGIVFLYVLSSKKENLYVLRSICFIIFESLLMVIILRFMGTNHMKRISQGTSKK